MPFNCTLKMVNFLLCLFYHNLKAVDLTARQVAIRELGKKVSGPFLWDFSLHSVAEVVVPGSHLR